MRRARGTATPGVASASNSVRPDASWAGSGAPSKPGRDPDSHAHARPGAGASTGRPRWPALQRLPPAAPHSGALRRTCARSSPSIRPLRGPLGTLGVSSRSPRVGRRPYREAIVASSRRRPPQPGQASTSIAGVKRMENRKRETGHRSTDRFGISALRCPASRPPAFAARRCPEWFKPPRCAVWGNKCASERGAACGSRRPQPADRFHAGCGRACAPTH